MNMSPPPTYRAGYATVRQASIFAGQTVKQHQACTKEPVVLVPIDVCCFVLEK